jgi:hypothetical protein
VSALLVVRLLLRHSHTGHRTLVRLGKRDCLFEGPVGPVESTLTARSGDNYFSQSSIDQLHQLFDSQVNLIIDSKIECEKPEKSPRLK